MAKIACFGAAHIDRRAHALAPIAAGTSNPVAVTESPGGVARNVAEVLALLGDDAALVSILGRDRHGQTVASQLTEAGVDLTDVVRDDDLPTATYTALVEPDGRLYVGLADMAIYTHLTPEALEEAAEDHKGVDAWFLDANLPPESITWLAARSPGFLAANPVSVPKARRLRTILDRLDLLVSNKEEAEVIADVDGGDSADHATWLHEQGVKVVAITTHEHGATVVWDGGVEVLGALAADAQDVTGAGDAFTATMLHSLLLGRDAPDAARVAIGAAAITVEADASVAPDLSEAAARLRAGLRPDA
jgi:pseudouridine kinase